MWGEIAAIAPWILTWKGSSSFNPDFLTLTMDKFLNDMEREKPIRFTTQQLRIATDIFTHLLSSGGSGAVYKGVFGNGTHVAVKVLNWSPDKRTEEQFMAEVSTIGRIHQFNLVRLYCFCFERHLRALVYEYMPNGSFDKFLFHGSKILRFEKLHEIAIGTAKGIAYLHEECQQRIVHYDIKPENIFWMQICFQNFGMLLFEIIGRRRNLDINIQDSQDWFARWVWKKFEPGELREVMVVCGIEEKDKERAERMVKVALWCVQYKPEARPLMSVVVRMLEGAAEIPRPSVNPFRNLMPGTLHPNKPVGSAFDSERTTASEVGSTYHVIKVNKLLDGVDDKGQNGHQTSISVLVYVVGDLCPDLDPHQLVSSYGSRSALSGGFWVEGQVNNYNDNDMEEIRRMLQQLTKRIARIEART
ncbi:lectin protein kinase family protein [Prunus dulcis]|uniref:Lectin protein kinase family protein n=1 Tax=Prunus dulcis TaxID=3755 RepID=A0A4Y1QLT9_PRUDU|nr:lectin protein kinase family protein [Prunus dulcis]